jgi:hypothetical protein
MVKVKDQMDIVKYQLSIERINKSMDRNNKSMDRNNKSMDRNNKSMDKNQMLLVYGHLIVIHRYTQLCNYALGQVHSSATQNNNIIFQNSFYKKKELKIYLRMCLH